jgi:hypothetical protein
MDLGACEMMHIARAATGRLYPSGHGLSVLPSVVREGGRVEIAKGTNGGSSDAELQLAIM